MFHTTYLRIEAAAGGVHATPREFIRAARRVITKKGKSRAMREQRHQFIRDGLQILKNQRSFYNNLVGGY